MILLATVPVFRVSASPEAFYRDRLGFEVRSAYRPGGGTDPAYLVLAHGDAILHLSSFPGDGEPGESVVNLVVDDLDALHADLAASGASTIAAAQTPEAETVVALHDIYSGRVMGQGVPDGVDDEIAATGAPEAVQAFYRAGLRGAPLLEEAHLQLPDRETLEMVFAVDSLHQVRGDAENAAAVAQAALDAAADHDLRRLVSTYYRKLFLLVGNKVRPFDLSGYDFTPLAYTGDPQLAAVFYLEAMRMSGTQIWGLINVPNPPNFAGAAELIAVFPRFEGEPYYAYSNADPGAFDAYAAGEYQSYRGVYIGKLYETLTYHLLSEINTTGDREQVGDLVGRSIMADPPYGRYSNEAAAMPGLREAILGAKK